MVLGLNLHHHRGHYAGWLAGGKANLTANSGRSVAWLVARFRSDLRGVPESGAVRERKWHHSQRIKELGNGEIELSLELSSLVEIVPWILSWGEHARAVAPRELVQEVAEVVKELGRVYG